MAKAAAAVPPRQAGGMAPARISWPQQWKPQRDELPRFLKQNLLDPLEMVDTDFYVPEAKRGRFAQAYDFNSGAAVPMW